MKPRSSGQRGKECQKKESMGMVRERPRAAPRRPEERTWAGVRRWVRMRRKVCVERKTASSERKTIPRMVRMVREACSRRMAVWPEGVDGLKEVVRGRR